MAQPSLLKRVSITWALLAMLGTALLLITPPAQFAAPVTSSTRLPAGIVFLRNTGVSNELWLADSTGRNEILLARDVLSYSISPDSRAIVYARQPAGQPSQLEIYDRSSTSTQLLVQDASFAAAQPAWSPAGGPGVIAYERRTIEQGQAGAPKLWLVQADGTDLGPVLKGGDVVALDALWSPNGTRMIFNDPLRGELVLFNFSDTLQRVPLQGDTTWAPDGQRLFVSMPGGERGTMGLVEYDLAQNSAQPRFSSADASDTQPRWSPDGNRVAFVRRGIQQPDGRIWVANLVTGELQPIGSSTALIDDTSPTWLPDGQSLLWTRFPLGSGTPSIMFSKITASDAPQVMLENGMAAQWLP